MPKKTKVIFKDINIPLFSLVSDGKIKKLFIKKGFTTFEAMNLAGMIYDMLKADPKLTMQFFAAQEEPKEETPKQSTIVTPPSPKIFVN